MLYWLTKSQNPKDVFNFEEEAYIIYVADT